METADAIVVGGGVVGASALYHLAALGVRRAILCERREPGAGASGASGVFIQLHFCQNAPEAALTLASRPYFQEWERHVGAGDCGFRPVGYLRLEPAERAAALRERVALLRPLGVETAVIAPDEAARLDPTLRLDDVALAAYEPGSGYADAAGTIAGFLAGAARRGGVVRGGVTVTGFRTRGGAIAGVETTAGPIEAPLVVVAAGAWSRPLLGGQGLDLPLTGALTQWFGFALPPGVATPRVTIGDGVAQSYYRSHGPDGRQVLIGLGGLARRPLADAETWERAAPAELVGLAHDRLATRLRGAAGARSVGGRSAPVTLTPDNLPIIDRHPGLGGLYYFAGDCGSSFKTAPAIGRALAEWAVEGRPGLAAVAAFGMGRFAGAVV